MSTALMPWAAEHYGCRVVEISEDGDYALAGHFDDRRALAAVLHYLRVDCGIPRGEIERWFDVPKIQRRWVIPVGPGDMDDEDGWVWADDDVRQPVTVVSL